MQPLSPEAQSIAEELARRHGFSVGAVTHMVLAIQNGNGGMAQFSHSEFGGSGQWMRGGMVMLEDMFNHVLQGRVVSLCEDIAETLAHSPERLRGGSVQSQDPDDGRQPTDGEPCGQDELFVCVSSGPWWPAELGVPNATGRQNNVRYAYFGDARRLAVQTGGTIGIYDTQDHRIGGFAQQQGTEDTITFTSQHGVVDLSRLPRVSHDGQPAQNSSCARVSASPLADSTRQEADIFSAIERLGDLKAKGILTDKEFATKKAELLARL
ncbi:SHOCT domain-containing protein [Halomonas sp. WWR20]